MRRWIAVATALLMAFGPTSALSAANQVQLVVPQLGGSGKNQTGTVDGAAHTTEMYPSWNQIVGQIIVDSLTVILDGNDCNSSNPQLGQGLTPFSNAHQYLNKWARILVTGVTWADTVNAAWSVRFYGSNDGVRYTPIMRSIDGASKIFVSSRATSRPPQDTLKVKGYGPMNYNMNSNNVPDGIFVPISSRDGFGVPYKNIVAVCSSDTTPALVSPLKFLVEIIARQQ